MRFVDRNAVSPPKFLHSKRVDQVTAEIGQFIEDVQRRGEQIRPPEFFELLNNSEIVEPVRELFGGCCAYCERDAMEDGIVLHNRPPGNAEDESGRSTLLNYVWLALDWQNLYWICPVCAQLKGNRFFVRNRDTPIGASVAELRKVEKEYLLDPCFHQPHEHARFRPDGTAQPNGPSFNAMIGLLKLNDAELRQRRMFETVDLTRALLSGEAVYARPTGGQGVSDAILVRGELSSPRERDPLPHRGAVTLAITDWLVSRGVKGDQVEDLLAGLGMMRSYEREEILQELLDEVNKPSEPAKSVTPKAAEPAPKRRRSRAFRRSQSPLTEALLDTITIRNFKALGGLELKMNQPKSTLDPTPCAVILGENATGKSSILEAVGLALIGTHEVAELDEMVRDEELRPAELLHRPDPGDWDAVTDEPLEIALDFALGDEGVRLTGGAESPGFEGTSETSKIVLGYGPRRYFSARNTRRFAAPAYRVRSLFDPLATIENPLDWLLSCDEKLFLAAVRALREVLLLDYESDVRREDGQLFITVAGAQVPLMKLSEGYKSVVTMAVDIAQELLRHYDNLEHAHATVLVDEIETHLHPRWKMQIVERLRKAFPRVQFIVTTHDPLSLRGMRDGEVFVLARDEAGNVTQLTDLPSVQGMRAEQLLTSEYFGLGSTDPATEAKLIRYNLLSDRDDLDEEEIEERDRLHEELSGWVPVGDTPGEQMMFEALKRANVGMFEPLQKTQDRSRSDMVDDLVSAIADIQSEIGAEDEFDEIIEVRADPPQGRTRSDEGGESEA